MFVALGCVLGACAQTGSPETPPNTAAAEVLWLPPSAGLVEDAARPVLLRNGRSIYADGSGAMVFSVSADCDDVARDISEHFKQTKWQPRSTQYLNPQLATSFSSGCRTHGGGIVQLDSNGRPIPRGPYNEWRGEWENEGGDIVAYVVGGTDRQQRGYASYVPRHVIEEGRRKLGR